MPSHFFEHPTLNSPFAYPGRRWELDPDGPLTDKITESRRRSAFFTPVPKPKKRRQTGEDIQSELLFKDEEGISTPQQQIHQTPPRRSHEVLPVLDSQVAPTRANEPDTGEPKSPK